MYNFSVSAVFIVRYIVCGSLSDLWLLFIRASLFNSLNIKDVLVTMMT